MSIIRTNTRLERILFDSSITEEKDNYLNKSNYYDKNKSSKKTSLLNGKGNNILSGFGLSGFDLTFAKDIKHKLSDVKGLREVKEEVVNLIDMIKNPEIFNKVGVKLHKGILLAGKPGTGKTLLAKAIAGECNVNFLFVTGSDFDETFVGVGAKRVKELFNKARKNIPCIIFIDEIDSLLDKSRRSGGEHSSSRSTLNQFLSEIDGFKNNEGIYIIGATNNENSLDPAAVRPGRFDKTIHVGVPDIEGRKEIIDYYLNKIKLKKDSLNSKVISLMTPGFTGAEIENLINLSIISSVSKKKDIVSIEEISESRDRVLMGIARKSFTVPEKRRYKTALHEAGHALVCYKNDLCKKNLHKLTVVPRGPAEGVTFRLQDEFSLSTKLEYLIDIDVAMGGQIAEEIMYGPDKISAGCSSDLDKATSLARSMIKNFGMYGENTGYMYVENKNYSFEEDELSHKQKKIIDDEVNKILNTSYNRVKKLLTDNASELKSLAEQCYIHDTLEFDEIKAAVEGDFRKIKAKKVRKPFNFIPYYITRKSDSNIINDDNV